MWSRVACLLLASVLMCACQEPEPDPRAGLPSLEGLTPDPERRPRPPGTPPAIVSVRHIQCSYRGAVEALKKIKLNREQARLRAGHLLTIARAKEHDFADLARRFSDDIRNSRDGGDLGLVSRGELHPDLEAAAFALGPGQVSKVVESPRGFHILFRYPSNFAQAAEILVTYTGAKRYTPRTPRTRAQAETLARQILERLKTGAPFGKEALVHSDHPNHLKGGFFPIFEKGSQLPQFEEIVHNLEIGQLSDIIETPTGFHIVKRVPVRMIQVRHILVKYWNLPEDPAGKPKEPLRSYQEAYELIEKVHRLASAPGADFAELASRYCDGPDRFRAGLMEPFGRGKLPYSFEAAAFALKQGEISKIIETDVGFHLIKRVH